MAEQQPPAEPEVTVENLEKMTNESEGYVPEGEPQKSADSESPEVVKAAPVKAAGEAPKQDDFSKLLSETPYKSGEELVKGYKNAAGELTRRIQEIKPYEQFLRRAQSDPTFANYLQQAEQQYLAYQANPAAFAQPQQAPDLYTPEGIQAYIHQNLQQERATLQAQYQRELAQIQQQAHIENMKAQFKAKYPDADPDELFKSWTETVPTRNPFEVAYHALNYDKLKSDAKTEERKSLNEQLENAGKNKTPGSSSVSPQAVKGEDILEHIGKHGSESAYKRFGKRETIEAIQKAEGTF
jgi:hypothetical protein